jgi:single-stranded DNA-binding protein
MYKTSSSTKTKMSNLNSVLIEGTISTAPYKSPYTKSSCYFILSNRSCYGRNKADELFEDFSDISIEVKGELAKNVFNRAKLGNEVRVVGRLRQGTFYMPNNKRTNTLYIIAEHAELRARG